MKEAIRLIKKDLKELEGALALGKPPRGLSMDDLKARISEIKALLL
jgi:hypothetical protein